MDSKDIVSTIPSLGDAVTQSKVIRQGKAGLSEWDNIETTPNNHTIKVLNVMRSLGKGSVENYISKNLHTCGEDYDNYIRKQLLGHETKLNSSTTKKKSPGKKKGKKKKGKKHKRVTLNEALEVSNTLAEAETYLKSRNSNRITKIDIQRLNVLKSIASKYDVVTENFKWDRFENNIGFKNEFVEFRLITLMKMLNHAKKNNKNIKRSDLYELAYATDKIMNALDIYEDTISLRLKTDLKSFVDSLKQTIDFSHRVLSECYPHFLHITRYDNVVSTLSIKPYPSQTQLLDMLRTHPEILIIYNTFINGGKTTTSGAISEFVRCIRGTQKASCGKATKQFMFICSAFTVREQVGRIVWNMGIGLAIATINPSTNKPIITKNYNCHGENDNIVVILADIASSLKLLEEAKQNGENDKYIVFFDEPTIGADQPDHDITSCIPYILDNSQKQMILSSATMPDIALIPETIKLYKNLYPDGVCETVSSKICHIGCEIVSENDDIITPHVGCKTVAMLTKVLANIRKEQLISRLYTAPIIYKMHEVFTTNGVVDLPNIDTYFQDIKNHSQEKIQEFVFSMLECLINMNDDEIVCNTCIPFGRVHFEKENIKKKKDEDEDDDSENDFDWNTGEEIVDEVKVDYSFNKDNLTTTHAHRYMGGCLFATNDINELAKSMYQPIQKSNIRLKNLLSDYATQEKALAVTIKNIEKKKIERDDKDNSGFGKFDKARRIDEITCNQQPKLKFPSHLQINTHSHIKKNVDADTVDIDVTTIRQAFNFGDIDFDETYAPDWILLLLLSGVGVYDPDSKYLDRPFNTDILNKADNNRLAYLVAGSTVSYGTNYPLSHVIVDDELAEIHSMNSIFQLINRAGRVGRSWTAHAYLGPKTIKRLINFIHGNIDTGSLLEAENMEKAVGKMLIKKKEHTIKTKFELEKIKFRNKLKQEEKKSIVVTIGQIDKTQYQKKTVSDSDKFNENKHRVDKPAGRMWRRNNYPISYTNKNHDVHKKSDVISGTKSVRVFTNSDDDIVKKVEQMTAAGKYVPMHLRKKVEAIKKNRGV
jgi:hypothetical protein